MNNVIAKNKSGWILHEFIDISEAQISETESRNIKLFSLEKKNTWSPLLILRAMR